MADEEECQHQTEDPEAEDDGILHEALAMKKLVLACWLRIDQIVCWDY